ncbi:hypothetical protein TNCV_151571 [Trichonephila clavipes]|uniref:Uncharacterized protein n=1 Tax=Trichonephila clavipes TaxID=2585209 RepID=A0A8X6RKQ9_TRICX|nr:hypothetical protein TNCV_151571 [Trichonephila clavipes]
MMLSILQYQVFPDRSRQKEAPDWTPGVKVSFCKTAVDYFPGNSSSRHSSKVTRRLRSHFPPVSSCA